ncbi:sugar-transfer associated ATP-grasp domain-containing protein [uncultured Tateyamaria sp.]|uniref:sugar-transfer associated ATP-grasp domain-containing protein n=1 Tax=Tateyamaria sp. 1078 TaxID=3417464 RepID=UPI00262F61B2|nr:sugar-transfer associated ATP-grasp domain-containing protein [uncultured Tateyamaria sp.]
MTDTSMDAPKGALLDGPEAATSANTPVIVQVAKQYGVSPLRQLRESWSMRGGAQKLGSNEYYSLGLFDPDMPRAAKRAFVGQKGINAINARMNPPAAVPTRAFVGNKLLYTQLLEQLGIATARTQALVSTHRCAGQMRVLRDAATLAAFLEDGARYPLFGKPHHGSLSEGSVRLTGCAGGVLHIANGDTRPVMEFAEEIMRRYPGGFILQSALDPHPDMAHIAGPAIGCVRVVTINDGDGPTPAYAVWKLPAPRAMSDNFWQAGSLLAHLDLETGAVTRCVMGTGLAQQDMPQHPVSGAPIVSRTIPHWDDTLRIACDAHAVFPEFGICGFDIAVTADGPKVLECNDNPSHNLYQIGAGRGLLSPDLAPLWDRVADRQAKQLARLKSK